MSEASKAPATVETKTKEQVAAEVKAAKEAAAAKLKADREAAKAAAETAKAAAKAQAAEAKAAAKLAAEAEKAKANEAAEAAKKEAADKRAAEAKAKAEAKEVAKATKVSMPSKNGVTRPRPEGACGKVWAIADKLSAEMGQPVPISSLAPVCKETGLNDATVRTQYARWKLFNGVFGAVPKPAAVVAPAAVAAAA